MRDKIEIRAQPDPWWNGVSFMVMNGDNYCVDLVFKKIPDGQVIPSSLNIGRKEAQILIDDLWQCGFRPSEGTGSAGSLRATENHLNDMRKIVFKKLNIGNDK